MSAISDYAARVETSFARMTAAVQAIGADVAWLKAKIEELQTTPGPISPEDQAILDQMETRVGELADALDGVDALTPPAPPVG